MPEIVLSFVIVNPWLSVALYVVAAGRCSKARLRLSRTPANQ